MYPDNRERKKIFSSGFFIELKHKMAYSEERAYYEDECNKIMQKEARRGSKNR